MNFNKQTTAKQQGEKKKKKESKTKKKRRSAHLLSRQYTNQGMFCYLMISLALGLDIRICSLLQY